MAELRQSSSLRERVVPFTAGDGFACNLINVRGEHEPTKGPVILVHGAGVRANIFRAPVETTTPESWLVALGAPRTREALLLQDFQLVHASETSAGDGW